MRVLFIIPKLQGGGAENIAAQLASALADRHEVAVACLHSPKGPEYPLDRSIYRINLSRGFHFRNKVFLAHPSDEGYYFASKIARVKRAWKPDVSISFLERSNYLNALTMVNERTIASIRNNYSMKFPKGLGENDRFREWANYVNERVEYVSCISEYVRHDQIENFGAQRDASCVIYNMCNAQLIKDRSREALDSRDAAWFAMGGPVVLAIGRLVVQKGHWHLVRAFREVIRRIPEARLVILGEGPLRRSLEGLVRACGLSGHVLLAGHRANPYPFYENADVFAFPSLFEGLGNALLESMALGVPAIAADCPGGPRELLSPGCDPIGFSRDLMVAECGMLSPACSDIDGPVMGDASNPFSVDECVDEELLLAEGIVRLLTDEALRMRLSAAAEARASDFAPQRIVGQWEALFYR